MRLTEDQYQALVSRQSTNCAVKPSKYRNKKIKLDGRLIDSKREAKDYTNFKRMVAAKILRGYVHQVTLRLPSGKRSMRIDHMEVAGPADSEGWVRVRFSDSKGYETPAWSTKRDELEYATGICVKCK